MLGRNDENQFIAHAGRQTFLARPERMPADDPKIELAAMAAAWSTDAAVTECPAAA